MLNVLLEAKDCRGTAWKSPMPMQGMVHACSSINWLRSIQLQSIHHIQTQYSLSGLICILVIRTYKYNEDKVKWKLVDSVLGRAIVNTYLQNRLLEQYSQTADGVKPPSRQSILHGSWWCKCTLSWHMVHLALACTSECTHRELHTYTHRLQNTL